MQANGNTLTFSRSLWVQYGGVDAAERGDELAVTGLDEDSFLKVFNHFGRVLKLYTFEDGRWVDTDTGLPAGDLDESQAGRLPSAQGDATSGGARTKAKAASGQTGSRKAAGRASPAAKQPARAGAKAASPAKLKPASAKPAPARATAPKAAKPRKTAVRRTGVRSRSASGR